MIRSKKLAQLAKKLQRMVAAGSAGDCCSTASVVAGKGHCVVYAADGARFEVPLAYLGELLRMSQEECGFASHDGRITLPCDASVMEYAVCLIGRDASEEVERAFLSSMVGPCCNVSGVARSMGLIDHQFAVCT